MRVVKAVRRYFLTGLFVLLPAWGTFLILRTLLTSLDSFLGTLLGPTTKSDIPGLGLALMVSLIMLTGVIATQVIGQGILHMTEKCVSRIPIVRTIYLTLKGMTDLFNFRARFGRSTVVVFPFPREGLRFPEPLQN